MMCVCWKGPAVGEEIMSERFVESQPYRWPFNGDLRAGNTALLVIDMQSDFLGEGGFLHRIGGDYTHTRVCIQPILKVLAAVREAGGYMISSRGRHPSGLS